MTQDEFHYPYDSIALKYIDQSIVKQLIKSYKRGDSITKIKLDFPNAPVTNSLYVNLPYELTDEKCICGNFIYRKVPGRTSYKGNVDICPNCWHDANKKFCECQYCTDKRLNIEKKENEDFSQRWIVHCESFSKSKRNINNLDINDILNLLIIFKHDQLINFEDGQFNIDFIHSSHNGHSELLNVRKFNSDLIDSLQSIIDRHVFAPVKELTPNRIELLKRHDDLSKIPFYLAKWMINIEDDLNLVNSDIKDWILQRSYNEDELNFFWLELYQSELDQYLNDQVKENLGFALNDMETLSISEYLSEIFPLSKAFNLIYFSVSSALRFQVQKKPKEKILRNYLVNKILDMAEQKKENLYILKDFNRPANISVSVKAQIIRKNIFKLDNDHFTLTKTNAIASIHHKKSIIY